MNNMLKKFGFGLSVEEKAFNACLAGGSFDYGKLTGEQALAVLAMAEARTDEQAKELELMEAKVRAFKKSIAAAYRELKVAKRQVQAQILRG